MRRDWNLRIGVATTLLVLAGTALPVLAQDDPPVPDPASDPHGGPATPPDPESPPIDRERLESAARLREQLRQKREAQRAAAREAQNASNAPGAIAPNGAVAEAPLLNPEPGTGDISLVFEGPVDMSAFVDFVARTLQINIIEDQGLAGRSVLFRAPLTIPRTELLPLLRALLEDSGYALVYDDLGFYRVRSESGVKPSFGGGDLATTRIIHTPLVRPSVAAQTITQQVSGGGATGGPGGVSAGANFRMTPVDELGIIIATGSSGTLETIERFANQLVAQAQSQPLIRIELRNVSAAYARSRVIALNSGAAASAQPNVPGQAPGAVGTSGLLGNLESRLFIDQGNALLFRGSPEEAELLNQTIAVLDEITPLIVRRYVAGSVAMEAARAGERLGLGPVTLSSDSSTSSAFGGQRTLAATGVRGGQVADSSEPAASGFTVDAENGSLIYYGTESQHARVQDLVEQFKLTAIGDDIEIKTYKLLYAKATDDGGDNSSGPGVVDILTDLLENPADRTTRSPFLPGSGRSNAQGTALEPDQPEDAGPPTEGATRLLATEENTIIVADPSRNQIIIKAPRKAQAQFAEIIAKLDEKQPQVMLDVKIVSVTTTDLFDWQADVQLNFGQFSWFSGFGASIAEGATAGATTLDPRTLAATSPGLTTGWIKSDYLPIAIKTLESVGETNVVSNPGVLVNDNTEATIKSVREVPYSSSSQSSSTTIVSQGGVAEAGTTVTVTPRISLGGDISIDFEVELSDFTGAASGGLQPPKQTDNYSSSVTLPSDSTIVVGGFKLKRDSTNEDKIPFLGDIPLLGAFFKDYNKSKTHSVVYVFITPRIMRDPLGEDLRLATRGPMSDVNLDPDIPDMTPAVIPFTPKTPTPFDSVRPSGGPDAAPAATQAWRTPR